MFNILAYGWIRYCEDIRLQTDIKLLDIKIIGSPEAHDNMVEWDTVLQVRRSLVRFPMSLDFSI
jgi:hypothetical protein